MLFLFSYLRMGLVVFLVPACEVSLEPVCSEAFLSNLGRVAYLEICLGIGDLVRIPANKPVSLKHLEILLHQL